MGLVIFLWDEPPMGHQAGALPAWGGSQLGLWCSGRCKTRVQLCSFFCPKCSSPAEVSACPSLPRRHPAEPLACLCGQGLALGLHPSLWSGFSGRGRERGLPRPCSVAINPRCTQKQACLKLWL